MAYPWAAMFQWLERLRSGDTVLPTEVAYDEDENWRRLVELIQQVGERWREERQNTVLELAANIRQAGELHERELALRAEREKMEKELLDAERKQETAELESKLVRASKMAAIGTLAAGVAHEINNPLSYVVANLSYMAEHLEAQATLSAGSKAELLALISESGEGAERIRRIVRDLRTYSRLEEVTGEEIGGVDVRAVLDSAATFAANEIRHRAQLHKEYSGDCIAAADESRLEQVFINLLINAAHAIPAGDADANEIHITATTTEAGTVVIKIRDTGCGIPPETLERIFDPFFTTKSVDQGTGLGLAVCAGILAGFDGSVHAASAVGAGTTMTVELPGHKRCQPAPKPPRSKAVEGDTPARVLVIDDDPLVAKTMRRALRGNEVTVAKGGRDALALMKSGERHFDVILCDLMMPDVTGMDVYQNVRSAYPDLSNRFVFVSGGAFTPKAREFLNTTARHCINKPFKPQELRAIVQVVVAQSAAV